jgi:uncharacterized membrane protein
MFGNVFHACLLRHGKVTDLGQLPSSFTYSEALLINARGQIAGDSASPDNEALAVLWQHGKLINLGTPAGYLPIGLNDRGDVLVSPDLLWQRGHITDLSTVGVASASLFGINNRGELAGSIYPHGDATVVHAALWR